MLLIQLGHRTLNLNYLIIAEDSDIEPPPKVLPDGIVRVFLERGHAIDFDGEHANRIRRVIAELISPQVAPIAKHGRSVSSRRPRKE